MQACMYLRILAAPLFVLLFTIGSFAMPSKNHGILKGRVVDAETAAPLPGATISIVNTPLGAVSNAEGRFEIIDLPVGSYTVQTSYVGYQTLRKTDIIIRPERISEVLIALPLSVLRTEDVVADAGYFNGSNVQSVSSIAFSSEEIRRSPGSAGDVSRIIAGLPSLAKINDQQNSLIVRGGSPIENAFYVDNIEIPNINHFPSQGSSGGPIGMLHVDFVREVEFSAGGFGASYGDRLSSVMKIDLREGNRENMDTQLDFNLAGIGLMSEGPLFGSGGSWMASFRRSYLDFLVGAIAGDDDAPIPEYSDWQTKLNFELDEDNSISFIDIGGIDNLSFAAESAREHSINIYSDINMLVNTAGLNWRRLWGPTAYSQTSISHTITDYNTDFFETASETQLLDNNSVEQEWKLRKVTFLRLAPQHELEFGFDAKIVESDYEVLYAEYTDPFGTTTPEVNVRRDIASLKAGAFLSYSLRPLDALELTPGLRFDYFDYTGNTHVSPRFAWSFALNDLSSIYGSWGLYYQNLPTVLVSQREEFKQLADPRSTHSILGFRHLLNEDTRLTLEGYYKTYDNFPLDPAQPQLFIIDEVSYRHGLYLIHESLVDNGEARSAGVELTIQKKLARDFYGLVSGAYFRSEYRDFDGKWRDRIFDNRYLFAIEGGYKPGDTWEFSLRWIYAGGAPTTPFDMEATRELNRGVLDESRVNEERLPDYHSLNLRVDKRFNFESSNLILFLSIWNVYGRENLAAYEWNEVDREIEEISQWGTLPVLGLEFEF